MIDYKVYQRVLAVIESVDGGTPEQRASLICELFDKKETQALGGFVKPYTPPNQLYPSIGAIPSVNNFPKDAFGVPIVY